MTAWLVSWKERTSLAKFCRHNSADQASFLSRTCLLPFSTSVGVKITNASSIHGLKYLFIKPVRNLFFSYFSVRNPNPRTGRRGAAVRLTTTKARKIPETVLLCVLGIMLVTGGRNHILEGGPDNDTEWYRFSSGFNPPVSSKQTPYAWWFVRVRLQYACEREVTQSAINSQAKAPTVHLRRVFVRASIAYLRKRMDLSFAHHLWQKKISPKPT